MMWTCFIDEMAFNNLAWGFEFSISFDYFEQSKFYEREVESYFIDVDILDMNSI